MAAADNPLPPDNNISRFSPVSLLPLLNNLNVICGWASMSIQRLIIFSHFDESIEFNKAIICTALPETSYTRAWAIINDVIHAYKSRGGDLLIF